MFANEKWSICVLVRLGMALFDLFWYCMAFLVFYGLLWQTIDLTGLLLPFLVVIDPNSSGLVYFHTAMSGLHACKKMTCKFSHSSAQPTLQTDSWQQHSVSDKGIIGLFLGRMIPLITCFCNISHRQMAVSISFSLQQRKTSTCFLCKN